ncbi:21569_t:CDS:1, partial [Dentiscutata erythropus]
SLNSLDNNNVNNVSQIIDFKSESTKTQSLTDVDLDDDIAHETIDELDEQINGITRYRWRCGTCCRSGRHFRCWRCASGRYTGQQFGRYWYCVYCFMQPNIRYYNCERCIRGRMTAPIRPLRNC